jgi:hypothetical protein
MPRYVTCAAFAIDVPSTRICSAPFTYSISSRFKTFDLSRMMISELVPSCWLTTFTVAKHSSSVDDAFSFASAGLEPPSGVRISSWFASVDAAVKSHFCASRVRNVSVVWAQGARSTGGVPLELEEDARAEASLDALSLEPPAPPEPPADDVDADVLPGPADDDSPALAVEAVAPPEPLDSVSSSSSPVTSWQPPSASAKRASRGRAETTSGTPRCYTAPVGPTFFAGSAVTSTPYPRASTAGRRCSSPHESRREREGHVACYARSAQCRDDG